MNITNADVLKYEPLVNKIANQLNAQSSFPLEDLVQYGFEGLINAFNNFDENSNQTFLQYAAWQIRYAILNANNNEGGMIKYSHYNRSKNGNLSILSIDHDDNKIQIENRESITGAITNAHTMLFTSIEKNFSSRDCEIFYKCFGLKHFEETPGKEIAKEHNISAASVSIIKNKIISYIQSDQKLIDILSELL